MSEKLVGTVVLDGLVQGRLPGVPDTEQKLRDWVASARRAGLNFNLEIDAGAFSVLADNRPLDADSLKPTVQDAIADLLDELLRAIPTGLRTGLVSTVRSNEYRPGREIQTVYGVGPDGAIHTRQREVDVQTVAPAPPLTGRQKARIVLVGLGVAAVLLAISALFVDYGKWISVISDAMYPLDAQKMPVDVSAFGDRLVVSARSKDSGNLVITLKRGEKFPLGDEQLDAQLAAAAGVRERLALEAIARGYVRCEYFDAKGKFITSSQERIADLRDKETVELTLPILKRPRQASLRLAY